MGEGRPSTAYMLSLVGLVFQIVGGIMVVFMASYWNWGWYGWYGHMGGYMMAGMPFSPAYWINISILFLIIVVSLGIVGLMWMNSKNIERVRTGSILVLVASLVAFPTMWGFFVGSILMLIGSLMGLTWKPEST